MSFSSFSINRWLHGSTLVSEPDAIPDDALRIASNVRLDRTLGAIEARPGWSTKTATALSAGITYLSKLFAGPLTYGYAQVGTAIQRLTVSSGAPFGWSSPTTIATAGTQLISDADAPDGFGHVYKYLVNATLAVKDNGTTTSVMGIAPPGTPPLGVSLAPDLITQIDTMKAATNWVGTNITGTTADDTTFFQIAPTSVRFLVGAATFGSISQVFASTINIDTLVGGDALVKNDDYVYFWIHVDFPDRVTFLQVDVDVDPTTTGTVNGWRTNYYSIRLAGLTSLNQAYSSWTEVQIRKSAFVRFGQNAATWAAVKGIKIGVLTNTLGGVVVNIDDLKLRGGIGLEGNISYTVTYRNSSTGGRGNPPKDSNGVVQYTAPITTNRRRISVDISNLVRGASGHPVDPQIDTLMLWRLGGTFTTAVLVASISDTATPPYLDVTSDATLVLTNQQLETDNDVPPTATASRVLFGPDASGHFFMLVDGIRLYISKAYQTRENRVDNWPALGYALVGDGSDLAVAGTVEGTQIRVWTSAATYQVVGVGQDTFLPVYQDGSRGIVGQEAWATGEGVIFFVSQDGIYADAAGQQTKLTRAIDPFFQGVAVDGQPALGVPPDTTRLAYLHQPQGGLLLMTTPSGFLVVKPNLQTGALSECFFGTSALTQILSLDTDERNRGLVAGGADGNIYTVEDETRYADVGTGLALTARTKSYDLGQPQHGKLVASAVFEGNTNGQALTLTAVYDRGQIREVLSTSVVTTSETGLVLLPMPQPTVRRRDIALEVTGMVTQRVVITRLGCLYELQPEPRTFVDSGLISFDFVQQLKRFEVDIDLPTLATLTVYADGKIVFPRPGIIEGTFLPTAGRVNIPYYLPAGLQGRVWRVTLLVTGMNPAPCLLYTLSGFFKQLGVDQQYAEKVLVQGV